MPWAFKKDAFLPRCFADGVIGYSAEGIANTWKVLTKRCSHDLSKVVDPAGKNLCFLPRRAHHGNEAGSHQRIKQTEKTAPLSTKCLTSLTP